MEVVMRLIKFKRHGKYFSINSHNCSIRFSFELVILIFAMIYSDMERCMLS